MIHWLHISHLRAVFASSARRSGIPVEWRQSNKHKNMIPDALITVEGETYSLEADNSTEGMRKDRIAGKRVDENTLVVAFRSEARFQNLATIGGLSTWHGYFHDQEDSGFNILTDPIWWNGEEWRSLL